MCSFHPRAAGKCRRGDRPYSPHPADPQRTGDTRPQERPDQNLARFQSSGVIARGLPDHSTRRLFRVGKNVAPGPDERVPTQWYVARGQPQLCVQYLTTPGFLDIRKSNMLDMYTAAHRSLTIASATLFVPPCPAWPLREQDGASTEPCGCWAVPIWHRREDCIVRSRFSDYSGDDRD